MTHKATGELSDDAWQMHNSIAKLKNFKVGRMAHMTALAQSNCVDGCNVPWLKFAIDVLHKNRINRLVFLDAFGTHLKKSKGKHSNIMLLGQRDCAKTFPLEPLTKVFTETFCYPASLAFGWNCVDIAPTIVFE